MANLYKAALTVLIIFVIGSDLVVIASKAHRTSIENLKRKFRKQLLKRSTEDQEMFRTITKNDDLIRTPHVPNAKLLQLSPAEKQQLQSIYGAEALKNHGEDLSIAKTIGKENNGADEHKIPWDDTDEPVTGFDQDVIDEVLLKALTNDGSIAEINPEQTDEQKRMLDPTVAKNLLESLLTRIDDSEEKNVLRSEKAETDVTLTHGHCNLHGLWLSTVAGAAIELIPIQQEGHIEIKTKIFDLPDNPEKGMITSQWTGRGVISSESPTTITIVFQEHLTDQEQKSENEIGESEVELPANLPKTAVFVGQCLVCENSPVLQGTWVVFPNTQSCFQSANDFIISHPESRTPISSDTLYLLER